MIIHLLSCVIVNNFSVIFGQRYLISLGTWTMTKIMLRWTALPYRLLFGGAATCIIGATGQRRQGPRPQWAQRGPLTVENHTNARLQVLLGRSTPIYQPYSCLLVFTPSYMYISYH